MMSDLYTYINQLESVLINKSLDEGADKPAVLPSTETHVWGRIVEVGKITIEVGIEIRKLLHFFQPNTKDINPFVLGVYQCMQTTFSSWQNARVIRTDDFGAKKSYICMTVSLFYFSFIILSDQRWPLSRI